MKTAYLFMCGCLLCSTALHSQTSPYAGIWTGTTSDNRPVYFRVNTNGVIDSMTVQVRLDFVTVACTYILSASSKPLLAGDSIIVPVSGVISTTMRGKFNSVTGSSGKYDSYSGGVFAMCGNNLIIGTTSLSSKTWQVTKTGEVVPPTSLGSPVNTNGGFEGTTLGVKTGSDIDGWSLYTSNNSPLAIFGVVSDPVAEGSHALAVTVNQLGMNPFSIQVIGEPISVLPHVTYRYSAWAKANKAGAAAYFSIGTQSFAELGAVYNVFSTTGWQEIQFDFTNTTETILRAPMWLSDSSNNPILPVTFYIDNVRISPYVATDVISEQHIPQEFQLFQNYPNPFNPRTVIRYELQHEQFVRLTVFDGLGQRVAVLVDGQKPAGTHSVIFDAENLPSGVYLYRIETGGISLAKRLVVLK